MEVELSEEERRVKSDFEAVCRKLNMDQDSMEAAWTSYDKIKDNYTLEVRDTSSSPSLLASRTPNTTAS